MKNQLIEEAYKAIQEEVKELYKDHVIDETRLRDVQLKHPTDRAKWVEKKHLKKAQLKDLRIQLRDLLNDATESLHKAKKKNGEPTKSKAYCENLVKNSKQYKELESKVFKSELIYEFFEDAVGSISRFQWDISTFVKTIDIEER